MTCINCSKNTNNAWFIPDYGTIGLCVDCELGRNLNVDIVSYCANILKESPEKQALAFLHYRNDTT